MPRASSRVFVKRRRVGQPRSETESADSASKRSKLSTSKDNVQTPPRITPLRVSSSKKKLAQNNCKYSQFSCSADDTNDIINFAKFGAVLEQTAVCAKCCKGVLPLSILERNGLSVEIVLKCKACGNSVTYCNSETLQIKHQNVNVQLVYGMRSIGKGEAAARMLCGVMNLPNPPNFKRYTSVLRDAAKDVCREAMFEAVVEAKEENDGDPNLSASFDGTWGTRGHTSQNGVVSAININTCKVIDMEVLSKFCRCKNKLKKEHEADCMANYSGSSGGMEVEGVLRIYKRSEALNRARYVDYLGDGDSASHPTVVSEKPYGPDIEIKKLECVGHVQKRMGSRLKTFKAKKGKTKLDDGKTVGGRGRLTDTMILEIQRYYGLAIRRNTHDLNDMKMAVWATYFHLASTNEKPSHGMCEKGLQSWCKYQKSISKNIPYDHNKHTHLSSTIMEEIKPIFRDLADPELLRKCLHGGTQNPNESLNNIIWARLPKTTFIMRETLEFGTYEAVACYNRGHIVKCQILDKLGINPGSNCVAAMKRPDEIRIQKAEKKITEIEKKCRQKVQEDRK